MTHTTRATRAAAGTALAAAVATAGCDDPDSTPARLGEAGPVPATQQGDGDPRKGYEIIVNRGYVTCGMPYDAYAASRDTSPVEQRLPGRTGRNAQLPYHLNATERDGAELVVTNCLTCHGATFDGELIVGLGNEFRDFTSDPAAQAESLGLYVENGPGAQAWQRWADRIAAIAPYMRTDTIGVNPAPNVTMALMAHRDPETLQWHEEPRLEPPPQDPLPVSVPPWWRMQKKHAMFYHGAGRGDHAAYMMLKSLVCTDDVEQAREIREWFTHVRAYIASLEPPDYPYTIDPALATRGKAVFQRACAGCHGRYDGDEPYPNLIIPLEEIGTDPAYARQAVKAERFIRWFNRSYYGQHAEARPAPGYVAPPLDGVWATAPYLHNGSVPTIAALLDSDRRPTYWRHHLAPREYDPDTLGWRHERLGHGKDGAADEQAAKRIYDTTRHGYGNAGHTYGDGLADGERRAVVEYLKTL
ncbi:hypothetical protein [Arhodomonas sp. AD133]|uniref:c-type cytochrome n=1 Tax=Arhodomonas sp. AD133 TaxID=3415009 RepID=UPI003EC00EC7